jgi:hypothetical protein
MGAVAFFGLLSLVAPGVALLLAYMPGLCAGSSHWVFALGVLTTLVVVAQSITA